MKKRAVILVGFTTLALVASLAAQADTGTSKASVKKVLGLDVDKMILRWDGLFTGAKVTDLLSPVTPDINTGKDDMTSPININHNLSLGYNLSPSLALTGVLDFDTNAHIDGGDMLQMRDPWLRLNKSGLIKRGNLTMNADLRVFAPTSVKSGSVDAKTGDLNRVVTVGSKQVTTLTIPGSRFDLVAYSRLYLYGAVADHTKVMRLYLAPSVEYQISPKVTASLLFESDNYINANSHPTTYTDLEPGVSWDITPNVNFSPFLDLKTSGSINMDTTQIGATFGIKML